THKEQTLDFCYPRDTDEITYFLSRDLLELRLIDPKDHQVKGCLFNCHLKSKLDPEYIDSQGKLRRRAEVEVVTKILRETRQQVGPTPFMVLGGDFNGIHSPQAQAEPEFEAFYKDFDFKELFEAVQLPQEQRATQIQFQGQKPYPIQIDGFWLSSNLIEKIEVGSTEVFKFRGDLGVKLPYAKSMSQKWAMPSDHYAVVTCLSLPA
ncbi:MAG: hypothetical protein KDD22_02515, partial [Bdellovibrionales bacterium]|nr:hypothetical protein [Bdellovibrionales bacterium]